MSKETFYRKVQKGVQNAMGDNYEVKINLQEKNNETQCTFLSIIKCGESTYPNIRLDTAYSNYQNGLSVEKTVERVLDTYWACQEKMDNISQGLTKRLNHWESIRDKLALCLVSKKRNENMLKQIVHKDVLDLAVMAVIVFSNKSDDFQTIKVPRTFVRDIWNVTEEKVLAQAEKNTRKIFPPVYHSLYDELFPSPDPAEDKPSEADLTKNLFIVSNETGLHGATTILYEDFLKEIYNDLGSNLYILPSSIHECLILPESGLCPIQNPEQLQEMVEDVNGHSVPEMDILSDSVYYYDGSSLSIAATAKEDNHE